MRFMIIVKATAESEAETNPVADEKLFADMAAYHEELAKAGVLLDGAGMQPSRNGWRVQYGADGQHMVAGPFAQTTELAAGYTLIQVSSREEALAWTRRFPNPMGEGQPAQIEVRQLYEADDFPQGDTLERIKQLGLGM